MSHPVVELCNLCKSYGSLEVTANVSLTVQPGEIHALIGPNGAGKSTLIKQIVGEALPDSGRVLLDGRDVTSWGMAKRARAGVGRIFQISSVLPAFTVLQNVVLAVQGREQRVYGFWKQALSFHKSCDDAMDVLEKLGLHQRCEVLAGNLSHGERRRLELAMAMALRPKIYLLDEPMAGIGSEGTQDMLSLIASLRTHAPVLLVEHDMDAVFSLADRISVLDYGHLIMTGTPDEVRRNEQVLSAYLGHDGMPISTQGVV
jgi:branched-chain amino acid transport system ATP-binding protein